MRVVISTREQVFAQVVVRQVELGKQVAFVQQHSVGGMKQPMLPSVRESERTATTLVSAWARRAQRRQARASADTASPHYKWVALSNTTLGVVIATINSSILLIALPDIFAGVQIN